GFPATVSNHVKDLLRHYQPDELPRDLVEGMERVTKYDYLEHGVPDAAHARAVTDDMAERLTLIGTAAEVRDKIARLESVGVTHVCLYLGIVEPEFHFSTLETYGREIIPHFQPAPRKDQRSCLSCVPSSPPSWPCSSSPPASGSASRRPRTCSTSASTRSSARTTRTLDRSTRSGGPATTSTSRCSTSATTSPRYVPCW